jgi:hypothetical protein
MNEKQRVYKKNRTNRRVRKVPYEGTNKRTGLGRRKHEVIGYYVYVAAIIAISAIATAIFLAVTF